MSEANKELVRRHFEDIWNRRDLAVADELMAEDYLEHAVAPFGQTEPGRVNGPAAMRETAWGRSTGWCHRPASGSRPARPTGSGSRTASWPSIGRPVRTFRRCCNWGSSSLPADRRPSVRRGPWR